MRLVLTTLHRSASPKQVHHRLGQVNNRHQAASRVHTRRERTCHRFHIPSRSMSRPICDEIDHTVHSYSRPFQCSLSIAHPRAPSRTATTQRVLTPYGVASRRDRRYRGPGRVTPLYYTTLSRKKELRNDCESIAVLQCFRNYSPKPRAEPASHPAEKSPEQTPT